MRILITGSARAIGAATADELSRAGHEVIATARDVSLLDGLDVAMRLPLDVSDEASVATALDQAGELDAIVNNAAVSCKGPMEAVPVERLRDMFETNTFGPLRLVQRVLPQWRSRGSGVVVNVSSVQGRVSSPLEGPYSATKHALEAISEALHYELGALRHPDGDRPAGPSIAPGMKAGRRRRRRRRLPARPVGAVGGDRPEGHRWPNGRLRAGAGGRRPSARAIEDPATPLRVPVGEDAVTVLGARDALDDAAFEAAMRKTLGMTW